jgi:hypothetical protein
MLVEPMPGEAMIEYYRMRAVEAAEKKVLTRLQPARVTRRCENPDGHLGRKALRALTFTASAHAPRIDRPEPRRGDRQNTALSFHQDIARIGCGAAVV